MPLELPGDGGRLIISEEAIAGLAGAALLDMPGLGRRPSRRMKDGLRELLGRENLSRGIEVSLRGGAVELEIAVAGTGRGDPGMADEIARRAREAVENALGLTVRDVRITVQENRPRSQR